jgi:transketolase
MDNDLKNKITLAAAEMRCDVINMTYSVGNQGAHIGGSLSLIELLATLYVGVIKIDNSLPNWEERDRVILSKGHGAMALYAALCQVGYIQKEDLAKYKSNDTFISAHTIRDISRGLEFASGSLGQGLSLGAGVCIGLRKKNNDISRVFVIQGDGEIDEGSVWEAAASAAHHKLNNLVTIIDKNNLQYDGLTSNVLSMENLSEKWRSFGWDVCEIDGHNITAIFNSLTMKHSKPLAVIAGTIKGKGVSFIENDYRWHHARLTKEQYEQALSEQGLVL